MLFFKMLGGSLMLLGGAMLSRALNRRMLIALRRAEAWTVLLRSIKNEIECFSLPIRDILKKTDTELLHACGYTREAPPDSLSELISSARNVDGETERIIGRFASEFGRCYRSEQVERCAYYISLMEDRRIALLSELPSKKRLNSTLCMAGSLGLLILFM